MDPNNRDGFRCKNARSTFRCRPNSILLLILLILITVPASAADRYTDHQLDALATRVGKIYWIVAVKSNTRLSFESRGYVWPPSRPPANESFEITELVGRQDQNPYYKVKFDSGKEAFIRPEAFIEELNLGIASVDPQAIDKKRSADAAEEEKKRIEWIQAQPWSRNIKEAAIKRQVIGGMNGAEVRRVLGNPMRVTKVKAQLNVAKNTALCGWFHRCFFKRTFEPRRTQA